MKQLGMVPCIALVLGIAACQPMYGGKPEKLHNPPVKKPPPEEATAVEIKYVEDCTASFQDDPRRARTPQPQIAASLLQTGETAMQSADKATDAQAKVSFIKDAIDKFRNALMKDPYNADATLQLALAYDRVLRKGCALAMLKRLAALTNNPKFATEANRDIDSIGDNSEWFKGYRKDATGASGR